LQVDVIAIGAGFAGLVLGNRCAELGLRALVLEKESSERYACNSRYSTGVSHILFQDMRLAADKLQLMIETQTAGCARRELIRALAHNSARSIQWLTQQGARFIEINTPTGRSIILAPPRRFKEGLDWEGRGPDVLLRRLEENLAKRGGVLLRGVRARELVMQHGACTGVHALHEGSAKLFECKAVVIADGGFPANRDMIRRHITAQADRLLIRAAPNATGDGLAMAEAAGAALGGFGAFYGHPVHRDAFTRNRAELWPFPMIDGLAQAGIVVGADGRRFTDEGRGGIALANALAHLDDPLAATLVFDDAAWNTVGKDGPVAGNPMIVSTGATLHKANGLGSLASMAGIAGAALAQTVASHNEALARGAMGALDPPRSMQPVRALPVGRPPFYAVPLACGITATMGGISIDRDCRALRADGSAIPGLYAAGSTIAGLEGGPNIAYVGGLSKAFVFGLIAAEAVAKDAARLAA
jgi:fumarate reductase flavoprotein subunit